MAHGIIKLVRGDDARYFEWSTVCDAPLTFGMTRDELEEYIREEYGEEGVRNLPPRLARCDVRGHSYLDCSDASAAEYLRGNRAGPDETELTEDEIWEMYCVRKDQSWVPERPPDRPIRHPWHDDEEAAS